MLKLQLKFFMTGTNQNLSLWENFIESIAQVLSKALTNDDTEKLIHSFGSLQEKLRQLSVDNLKRLENTTASTRFCKHKGSCTGNCFRSVLRSFIITFVLKYLLGFVPSLLTGKIAKKPSLILKLGGRDTTCFALFMSTFISSYKGVLCLMRWLRNKKDFMNAFVAGAVAGLSVLIDTNQTRRVMIALYLSTRTIHFLSRWLWRHFIYQYFEPNRVAPNCLSDQEQVRESHKGVISKRFLSFARVSKDKQPSVGLRETEIIQPTPDMEDVDDKHHNHHPARRWIRQTFGVMTMMISSSQILYSFVCEPDTLAKPYLSFLISHGGIRALQPTRARQYLDAMGSTLRGSINSGQSKFIKDTPSFLESIPAGYDVSALEPFTAFLTQSHHPHVMCSMMHPPTSSCFRGMITAFLGESKRAFNLYAPLNVIMTIIFRGTSILKNPKQTISKIAISTLRSVLFLTCYVTAAWSLPCLFRTLSKKEHWWMYYTNGLVAGSMVILEQPGRRLELGMYCLPRAIECLWNSMVNRGLVRNIP
jgi:hypothetical protein